MNEKKQAIIFDVDGTLAHMSGRIERRGKHNAPYCDWDAHDDDVDEHVVDMLNTLKDRFDIVILSGRKSSSKLVLETWLKKNDIHYDALYMREAKDNRKDSIIKKEIYEKTIKRKWNVWLVFDDRNQVVEMWRSLGLKVFQVNEGNF